MTRFFVALPMATCSTSFSSTQKRHDAPTRLLDDSRRTGVWPDSVQVFGGTLSMRLPTG